MLAGIILAAGKGTRLNCKDKNKAAFKFHGKPLVQYGVELLQPIVQELIVVVGTHADSVKKSLSNFSVNFVEQSEQLGTGHAVQIAIKSIEQRGLHPNSVIVGYADHMMFYQPEIVKRLVNKQQEDAIKISVVTTEYNNPNQLAWGRVVRNQHGYLDKIVEHKDANTEQKKIKELNAGFYCFDYQFLLQNIDQIKQNKVAGEYFLTDIFKIARKLNKKVVALKVPFENVGLGINTKEQLQKSNQLYKKYKL